MTTCTVLHRTTELSSQEIFKLYITSRITFSYKIYWFVNFTLVCNGWADRVINPNVSVGNSTSSSRESGQFDSSILCTSNTRVEEYRKCLLIIE